LLVRVGADQSEGGGWWNAPVNGITREFAYISIPETYEIRSRFARPYRAVAVCLRKFGAQLPEHLARLNMHLDPDFSHLTYGDQGERATQISRLGNGDLLVFYAGLADTNSNPRLVYAIIGIYIIGEIVMANMIPRHCWDENAHTRRVLDTAADDIVVRAKPKVSGRLATCIPIGEFRSGAYRVTQPLLREWGGLNVHDGYLQRSARLPELLNPQAFYDWFRRQSVRLLTRNN
jgi:putative DNA base modification enzyme with NMAD domain